VQGFYHAIGLGVLADPIKLFFAGGNYAIQPGSAEIVE
jgi:hypothetical protein